MPSGLFSTTLSYMQVLRTFSLILPPSLPFSLSLASSILQVESEGFMAHQEEMYLYGCQVLLLWRRRLMDKPQPVGVSRVAGVQDIQHVPFAATDLERKQSQWRFVNDRFL